MKLFAISDLHLSMADNAKSMTKFGDNWNNHLEKIQTDWQSRVSEDDIVLIAGDISWSMKLKQAMPDLNWIHKLNGSKVIIKGNHDYWWESLKQLKEVAPESIFFVQYDMIGFKNVAIGGTRLWDFPCISWQSINFTGEKRPEKKLNSTLSKRELGRLQKSLQKIPQDTKYKIAMTHYPPIGQDNKPNDITKIMSKFNIDVCVYGHIHSLNRSAESNTDCVIDGTRYILTSCDWLDFKLKEIII